MISRQPRSAVDPPPAFVLGLGPNGYGHVRSLVRQGVHVVGFHYSSSHFGRRSRLLAAIRPIGLDPSDFVSVLEREADRYSTNPVLFAPSDRTAFLLARCRSQLAERFAYHWLTADTAAAVFDKSEMSRRCEAIGIRSPRTRVTAPGEDVRVTARTFDFPCVIKPVRTFGTAFPQTLKTYVAESAEPLSGFYRLYPDLLGTTLWQELIDGPDHDIFQSNMLVGRLGTVLAVSTIRKLRQQPPGCGNMCAGRTERNEEVTDASLALLKHLKIHGFASVEFKRRASDGKYYFIELNARLPRYCGLLADADCNFPAVAYEDLTTHGLSSPLRAQRDGVYWVMGGEDFQSSRHYAGHGARGLSRWISSIARTRSFAWWNPRDPAPFAGSIADTATRMLQSHELAAAVPQSPMAGGDVSPFSVHKSVRSSRAAYDVQYERPREEQVGSSRFLLYDIAPPTLAAPRPILFCPGWLPNPDNHRETVRALYEQGRRVVFPDAPHGIDTAPVAEMNAAQLRKAALLLATLELSDITECDAIAHSEGAVNLAIAAAVGRGRRFRNIVLQSPAGVLGKSNLCALAFRAWCEARQQRKRHVIWPAERRLCADRRRLYWRTTLRQTLAEAHAICSSDIAEMLVTMRSAGSRIAIIHGADDRLFPMKRLQQTVGRTMVDGLYSVRGGHQQLLLEPSVFGRLANDALLTLERQRPIARTARPSGF